MGSWTEREVEGTGLRRGAGLRGGAGLREGEPDWGCMCKGG